MRWFNRRSGVPIEVSFTPQDGDKAELTRLVQSLRKGELDEAGKQKIILTHMKAALGIASSLARSAPWFKDDLASAAFMAVVKAVRSAEKKLINDDITSYIIATVQGEVVFALSRAPVFRPNATYIRNHKDAIIPKVTNESVDFIAKRCSDLSMIDLRDGINKAVHTPFEKSIVSLREDGHNDREIATILNCSKSLVHLTRKKIEERWETLCSSIS